MFTYEYLSDPIILQYVDNLIQKTQFVRILILDKDESVLKAVEGKATAGTVNVNGSSAVRRTANLTLVTEAVKGIDYTVTNLDIMNEVTNIKTLIAMNRRCKIEIGIKNTGDEYKNFDIFWFPLGTFMILNATVSYNNQGISISLKLSDKMSLLNGDIGGTINIGLDHSQVEDMETGELSYPLIREIIKTLLEYFGELNEYEYSIEDVPLIIEKNIVRWTGEEPVYINTSNKVFDFTNQSGGEEYTFGENIGYKSNVPFTWPKDSAGDLSSNAGDTVVSVLEKIKNFLGNYEYFFDLDGTFRFREIKNYLNEGSEIEDLTKAINQKYFINTAKGKSMYSFTQNNNLISAYQNDPRYSLIKNDYVVWGKLPDSETPIQYHLVIDKAPGAYEKNYWMVIYGSFASDPNTTRIIYANSALNEKTVMQQIDDFGYYVKIADIPNAEDINNGIITVDESEVTEDGDLIVYQAEFINLNEIEDATTNHKLKMYLTALEKEPKKRTPLDNELIEYFPQSFNFNKDVEKWQWKEDAFVQREKMTYYFDIINVDSLDIMNSVDLKNFAIQDIGKRTKVINDPDINCLFSPEINDLNVDDLTSAAKNKDDEKYFEEHCALGTQHKSAYDTLRSVLHESLGYNNNINLTTMPIYHLDVNQRITVNSDEADIHGDYIIDSMTIPLTVNGTMTINARKAIERI